MCTADVKSCKSKNPLIENYPGKILDCLTTKAGRGRNATATNSKSKLSEECSAIHSIAKPPDVKSSFDSYFQVLFAAWYFSKLPCARLWLKCSLPHATKIHQVQH